MLFQQGILTLEINSETLQLRVLWAQLVLEKPYNLQVYLFTLTTCIAVEVLLGLLQ